MQFSSLIAAGLAVSASNAFLLPFPSESSENDIVNTLPVPIEAVKILPEPAQSRNLKLNCPGCPVPVFGHRKGQDAGSRITTDIPSHLELDFTIDHASTSDRLMLNGFELYPNSDPMRESLAAQLLPEIQQRRPGHRKHHEPVMHYLGYGLQVRPIAKSKGDRLELIALELQVIEVGNVFVNGIPNVEVLVIKTPEGGLLIADAKTTESGTLQDTPMDKQEECTTMLCKWRAVVMQQLARLRTHKHCGARPGQFAGALDGVQRHPGHHNMHHGHRATWAHLFRNIASHIILPIVIGIVAGVTASILGMMVGTAIVCLWRTFVRPAGSRHHRHSRSRKAAHNETAVSEEKTGLMAAQEEEIDAPPAYVEEGLVEGNKKPENES